MCQLFADHRPFFILLVLFCLCTSIPFCINCFYLRYPGNIYYPKEIIDVLTLSALVYLGILLTYGRANALSKKIKELIYFLFIMSLILIGCMSVQYTPFNPIDSSILNLETWFHIDLAQIIQWRTRHPIVYDYLDVFYNSIAEQMTYFPLLLIVFGKFNRLREYYFLLLITALFGYAIYYFFPTTAPASVIQSPYFTDTQRATGIKFNEIHAHIKPSTIEGGMIAFPSFHVIWAWLCAFLIRDWPVAFYIMVVCNSILTISCILLGWHYMLDILGSLIVILIGHAIYGCVANDFTSDGRTYFGQNYAASP